MPSQEPKAGGVPSAPSKRRLSFKKKLFFSLFTTVALLLLVVGGLELAARAYIAASYGVPGKTYGIFVADDELGATHQPQSYNTNSQLNNLGFRNNEDTADVKPANSLRIYCSGGSTTYCYNLTNDQAWPSVLQKNLRAVPGHEKDEVLNAGQICFGVGQEFVLARRLIPRLKPDVVVLFTGVNEGMNAQFLVDRDGADLDQLLADKKWGVFSRNLDQSGFWLQHSVLVRLYDYKIKNQREKAATADFKTKTAQGQGTNGYDHPWIAANFDHTLRDYVAFLRQQGCRVIILRFGDNGADSWFLKGPIDRQRAQAVAVGRDEGAEMCDLLSVVEKDPRRRDLFIESGLHVTELGANVYADELMKAILKPDGTK